jgi:hypothetical protein
MAEIAAQPFTMKDVNIEIDGDDYKRHTSRVRFVPTVNRSTWKALAPAATYGAQGLAEWSCELALAQDWENPLSLANYLLENEGDEVTATFRPVAGGVGFTSTITLAPPTIGGDVDTTATAEITMACTSPVPVAAP